MVTGSPAAPTHTHPVGEDPRASCQQARVDARPWQKRGRAGSGQDPISGETSGKRRATPRNTHECREHAGGIQVTPWAQAKGLFLHTGFPAFCGVYSTVLAHPPSWLPRRALPGARLLSKGVSPPTGRVPPPRPPARSHPPHPSLPWRGALTPSACDRQQRKRHARVAPCGRGAAHCCGCRASPQPQ